jgi:hypothetical protein
LPSAEAIYFPLGKADFEQQSPGRPTDGHFLSRCHWLDDVLMHVFHGKVHRLIPLLDRWF